MGFWSGLGKAIGKIAPIAGGIAGAPFTGGASLFAALAPTIGQTVGSVLSGASGGMAGRRDVINEQRLQQQQLAQNAAYQRFVSELDAAKYGVSEQQRGARQSLVSQLLENMPQFGLQGMSPRIGQTSLTNTFAPSQDLLSRLAQAGPAAPTMAGTPAAQFQKAGFLEKLAGGAGLGLGVLGSLGQTFGRTPLPTSIGERGTVGALPYYTQSQALRGQGQDPRLQPRPGVFRPQSSDISL